LGAVHCASTCQPYIPSMDRKNTTSIIVGIAIGVPIGLAYNNVGIGIGIGLAIGIAMSRFL